MLRQMRIYYTKSNHYHGYFTVVQLMLLLLYFVVTVLAFIAHFYGLIMRSLLTESLELF